MHMEWQHGVEGNGNSRHDPSPRRFADLVCPYRGKASACANYNAQKNIKAVGPIHKCGEQQNEGRCRGRHGLSAEPHTLGRRAQSMVHVLHIHEQRKKTTNYPENKTDDGDKVSC
jgi:hypothetical protein